MNIGVFGSSYSRGNHYTTGLQPYRKLGQTGWPYELSLICDHNIYNYSIGGASIQFIYEQYQKHKHNNFDVVIFDAATFYRYTVQLQDIDMQQLTENYTEYSNECIKEQILRYTAGSIPPYMTKEEKASHHYNVWKRMLAFQYETIKTDYVDLLDKIDDVADITFFQRNVSWEKAVKYNPDLKKHPCIENIASPDKWQEYIMDKACHFNTQGSKWLAQWMLEKINKIYFEKTKNA